MSEQYEATSNCSTATRKSQLKAKSNIIDEQEKHKETDKFNPDMDEELVQSEEDHQLHKNKNAEKLKETDHEYKPTMEEEWASRQQILQILVDEAQQLLQRMHSSYKEWRQKPNTINERESQDESKQVMEQEWAARQHELQVQIEEAQQFLKRMCSSHRQERQKPNIINERERLKETDEYKEAIKEEWASRHRQLQIQAEEAGWLRKRKKAERMHSSNLEWWQKPNIINEKENLKETDEYKRAVEEEWASRRQQIQIQAEKVRQLRKTKETQGETERRKRQKPNIIDEQEMAKETDEYLYQQGIEEERASRREQAEEEAQSLRRKRKAENIERRQKQRVEEIREMHKKEEENLNLKMELRDGLREELEKLETTCTDMTSLLRALGIDVSDDVRAAYKQALLRFHPHRRLKTDIEQQVEGEEKFKLIYRMYGKFKEAGKISP